MWRQPKQAPLDASSFFADGMGDRPLVPGTIPRDHLREDDVYYTGVKDGKWVDTIPMPVTLQLLKRGQERFDIYCSPCHGRLGDGEGMISHRGMRLVRLPGNYHTERLRNMPVGHFYDVITNGYGAMFSYASRVEPQDRWAIAAYIRVLQLSQHAAPTDADAAALQNSKPGENITPGAAPISENPTALTEGGQTPPATSGSTTPAPNTIPNGVPSGVTPPDASTHLSPPANKASGTNPAGTNAPAPSGTPNGQPH
jgi:mono/diheme cytochrome c family protein